MAESDPPIDDIELIEAGPTLYKIQNGEYVQSMLDFQIIFFLSFQLYTSRGC